MRPFDAPKSSLGDLDADTVARVATAASDLTLVLDAADLPDCCNDMQTWAETGQLCKPGLDAAGFLVWAPAPEPGTVGTVLSPEPCSGLSPTPLSAPPGAPWRPPTGV